MKPFKQIKRRMETIKLPDRSYFVKNDSNIRFCHIENDHFQYIVFPFCDYQPLALAAQTLKDCGIVDGFREVCINRNHFYIELFQFRYHRHTTANGKVLHCSIKQPVEWCDLKLTQTDVKHFIARFELTTMPVHHTPVVPMYSRKVNAA